MRARIPGADALPTERCLTSRLVLAVLALALPAQLLAERMHALSVVHFEIADPDLELGAFTTLDVLADFDTPVLGFGIDLLLDPAVVDASLLAIGPDWTAVFAPDGDGLAGLAPVSGVTGSDVLLARLEVTRVGLAATVLDGRVTEGDLAEGFPLLGGGFDSFAFEPLELAAVPEPGSGLLLWGGLLGLGLRRRLGRDGRSARRGGGSRLSAALIAGLAAAPVSAAAQPACSSDSTDTLILPGSISDTEVVGASERADVVVGRDGSRAALWDSMDILHLLPVPEGFDPASHAMRANDAADLTGTGPYEVVGEYIDGNGGAELVRWTGFPPSMQLERLGVRLLPSGRASKNTTVHPDGGVIVGSRAVPLAGFPFPQVRVGPEPFRLEDGVLTDLPFPSSFPPAQFETRPFSPGDFATARAISKDGRVVVGLVGVNCGPDDFDQEFRAQAVAARWVDGGFEFLSPATCECIPGGSVCSNHSQALAVSADGSMAVGQAGNLDPAIWREGGAVELLPHQLRGLTDGRALAVSPDGRVVVGDYGGGFSNSIAFWWNEKRGLVSLEDLARDLGVDLDNGPAGSSWRLLSATSVSQTPQGGYVVTGIAQGFSNFPIAAFRLHVPCIDSDRDGLCDEWEEQGYIDVNGNGTFDSVGDVALEGADPQRMDIYVEIDVLDGFAFPEEALRDVEDAFARVPNSLIGNPGNTRGIALHLQIDDRTLPVDPWEPEDLESCRFPEFYDLKNAWFGTAEEQLAPAALALKRRLFRYAILGPNLVDEDGESFPGIALVPIGTGGPDFVVAPVTRPDFPRDDLAGRIMHELGHTLGLSHGGPPPVNIFESYKPNYHSVMNYLWSRHGSKDSLLPGQQLYTASWRLDYSRAAFSVTLDESALDENQGLGGTFGHAFHFLPVGPLGPDDLPRLERERGPIDFNRDGEISPEPLTEPVDLNELHPAIDSNGATDVFVPRSDWDWLAGNYCTAFRGPVWEVETCSDVQFLVDIDIVEPTNEELDLLLRPFPVDCNGNGVPDGEELAAGTAQDSDGDGLLDACEPVPGDCDADGDVDDDDRAIFVAAFGYSEGEDAYRECADLDADQDVTFIDYQRWVEARQRAQVTTLPEPSAPAAAAAALALLAALARRRVL